MEIKNLKVEFLTCPINITESEPRFSWELVGGGRNVTQISYRILVSKDLQSLRKMDAIDADMWDSGVVESCDTNNIVYSGKPLQSNDRIWYKIYANVNVGGRVKETSSQPSYFEMGLICKNDIKAEFICLDINSNPKSELALKQCTMTELNQPGYSQEPFDNVGNPAQYMRKGFKVKKGLVRAKLYATALGLYECSFNGMKAGDYEMAPGDFDYKSRLLYQAIDATPYITEGENVWGAVVGDGWYCGCLSEVGRCQYGEYPHFWGQLLLEYADGTSEWIVTDDTWTAGQGAVYVNDMLMGEGYDAKLSCEGFDKVGFKSKIFKKAKINKFDYNFVGMIDSHVKIVDKLTPVSVTARPDGAYIFDMGQNMVGRIRFFIESAADGDIIRFRHVEMLNDDGSIYMTNLRSARQTDYFVSDGKETIFEPKFVFKGFRYVEVSGLNYMPDIGSLQGIVLSSAWDRTGYVDTSDAMVNKLYSNMIWGQRGNFLSIPTDCPQRDERMGWTGDAQIFARSACTNNNSNQFLAKFLDDMVDAQGVEGQYTDVVPVVRMKDGKPIVGWGNAAWGDAGVIIPWTLYICYNDKRILEKHYEPMAKWVAFLERDSDELTRKGWSYGDWLSVGEETPHEVTNIAFFAYSTTLMSKIASVLGKDEDVKMYDDLFGRIRKKFNEMYVGKDGEIFGNTQTCYVLAVRFDLVDDKIGAMKRLVKKIEENGWHNSTGFIGVSYMLPTLCEYGYESVAYKLLHQTSYPSWLYSIRNGATTIWERWNSYTVHDGFGDPGMNSFNHYSLGSCCEWMYRYMGGIDTEQGYRRLKMKMRVEIYNEDNDKLEYADVQYHSINGLIKSKWKHVGNNTVYTISIPSNVTAEVWLKAACESAVTENGMAVSMSDGVSLTGMEDGYAILEIGSGDYVFTVRN